MMKMTEQNEIKKEIGFIFMTCRQPEKIHLKKLQTIGFIKTVQYSKEIFEKTGEKVLENPEIHCIEITNIDDIVSNSPSVRMVWDAFISILNGEQLVKEDEWLIPDELFNHIKTTAEIMESIYTRFILNHLPKSIIINDKKIVAIREMFKHGLAAGIIYSGNIQNSSHFSEKSLVVGVIVRAETFDRWKFVFKDIPTETFSDLLTSIFDIFFTIHPTIARIMDPTSGKFMNMESVGSSLPLVDLDKFATGEGLEEVKRLGVQFMKERPDIKATRDDEEIPTILN